MDGIKNNELFIENTQALFEQDQPLAYKLRKMPIEDFELSLNPTYIYDKKNNCPLYEDFSQELQKSLEELYPKYELYPILFSFGFGNGALIDMILKKGNKIVVFEDNAQILALAFAFFDFTKAIEEESLIIFDTSVTTNTQLKILFDKFKKYTRLFKPFIHSDYYAKYQANSIAFILKSCLDIIKHQSLMIGNNPLDAMQGFKQSLANIPTMLENPSLKDILKERKKSYKTGILVATGPSLHKQLKILKEYEEKALILCVDSAYAILHKAGIRPDFVFCLERLEATANFFSIEDEDFDKNTYFLLASLIHEKTLNLMKNRNFSLVNRPSYLAKALDFKDYNYLGSGLSVAHMAYEFGAKLELENIILIGQDLAYSKEGASHSKDHVISQFYDERKNLVMLKAYGGEGLVESNIYWEQFKILYESLIYSSSLLGIKTFNATEGGAYIALCIERDFKRLCKELCKEKKAYFKSLAKKKPAYKKIEKKYKQFIKECALFEDKTRALILIIDKNSLKDLQKTHIACKKCFLKLTKDRVFLDIIIATSFHFEQQIVVLEYKYCKDEYEKIENLKAILNAYKDYFIKTLATISMARQSIEKALASVNKESLK